MHAARTVELPVAVLIGVLRRENASAAPAVLAGGEGYVPRRSRGEADRAIRAELVRAGIAPDGEFRDLLTPIGHARTEFYGWLDTGPQASGVLVAVQGRTAVLLVRRGDRITLRRADPDHPAAALVSCLPRVPPGRGPSISVRAAEATAPNAGGVLRRAAAARSHDARRLDDLLRPPRLGGARLYAAARDRTGTRRRSAEWLTVLDIVHEGRWLIYTTSGGGDRAVNAVPATPELITGKLADLRRSIPETPR